MADQGLKARERLKKRSDIDRVFSEGTRLSSGVLKAITAPNGLAYSRIGVGASSRMCNAVKRNRLKRLVREAFRLNKSAVPAGCDVFIIPIRVDATFAQVQESLLAIASQLPDQGRS